MILPPDKKPTPPPFALEVLRRLPLAEAFYSVFGYTASDAILDYLFESHRGRCYQDKLSFAELVGVIADALTRYKGRGRAAILDALQRQQLSCQVRAVYRKLGRLPLPLAEAFLSSLTARLRPLFPAGLYRTELPASLVGLAVVVLDGKKIKKVAKRLLAARGVAGKLFGGKILAAYLPAEGLAVALAADPDGEANDIRLMPRVMPLARQAVAGPRLWVADRQFADLEQPRRFTEEEGDHFLIRYSKNTSFHPDPERAASAGRDEQGRTFRQEWGWLGAVGQGERRLYVRRITLERPGEEAVAVITDLLDERQYPAEDLLAVYLTRWQIENVFQQITEVFELRHLIGCTPQATVFQASLCLVIYNVLQLVRGYIALGQAEPTPVATLSAEMIFEDMKKDLVSLHEVLSVEELLGCLSVPSSAEQLKERLAGLLGGLWSPRWKKVVNKKPRPHKAKAKQSGAHTSVHKVLEEAKQRRPPKQPRQKQETIPPAKRE
jgi:hypothetical protein